MVIATKFNGAMGEGPNDRGASRGHIMDAVERSLERLQTDHIDLYQVHAFDPVTPIEETLRALDDLVSRGLVRYVGCSNWPAWRIAKALGISERRGFVRYETTQSYYTIAGRDLEREVVPLLLEEGMGLLVWSPLAGGLLSGKFGPGAPEAEGCAARRISTSRRSTATGPGNASPRCGRSPRRRASRWRGWRSPGCSHKPYVTSVIIGAKRVDQLDDNIAATALSLSADEIATLDAVSALPEEYPGWMVARQGGGRRPAAVGPDRD